MSQYFSNSLDTIDSKLSIKAGCRGVDLLFAGIGDVFGLTINEAEIQVQHLLKHGIVGLGRKSNQKNISLFGVPNKTYTKSIVLENDFNEFGTLRTNSTYELMHDNVQLALADKDDKKTFRKKKIFYHHFFIMFEDSKDVTAFVDRLGKKVTLRFGQKAGIDDVDCQSYEEAILKCVEIKENGIDGTGTTVTIVKESTETKESPPETVSPKIVDRIKSRFGTDMKTAINAVKRKKSQWKQKTLHVANSESSKQLSEPNVMATPSDTPIPQPSEDEALIEEMKFQRPQEVPLQQKRQGPPVAPKPCHLKKKNLEDSETGVPVAPQPLSTEYDAIESPTLNKMAPPPAPPLPPSLQLLPPPPPLRPPPPPSNDIIPKLTTSSSSQNDALLEQIRAGKKLQKAPSNLSSTSDEQSNSSHTTSNSGSRAEIVAPPPAPPLPPPSFVTHPKLTRSASPKNDALLEQIRAGKKLQKAPSNLSSSDVHQSNSSLASNNSGSGTETSSTARSWHEAVMAEQDKRLSASFFNNDDEDEDEEDDEDKWAP